MSQSISIRGRALALAVCALCAASAHAVNLESSGYAQNFDSMGASGTAPPIDWSVYTGASGTSNTTWQTSIPAAGVAAMVATNSGLTATSAPTATNNNGYNAALSPTNTVDRVLATSPTQVSGAALQLSLVNDTGAALSSINIAYDTVRFTAASTANELPGYWLFYSTDAGASWTNVAALNPTIATVPNTVGVTSTSGTVTFASAVGVGASVQLRWVDDNAVQTSPDQIIGLNNVSISPVPEPSAAALGLMGLAFVGGLAGRQLRSRRDRG